MRTEFLLILGIALCAASCRKEPSVTPDTGRCPVEFEVADVTKGMPTLSTLERLAAQDFSVSAFYSPEGEAFGNASSPYVRNHRFGLDGSTWRGITRSGGLAADPIFYPLDGTLSYFCYAPYRADVSDASDVYVNYAPDASVTARMPGYLPGSPLICFTPSANAYNQIDFIAAIPVVDVHRTDGIVPLDFTHHLTTAVQFWFKYTGVVLPGEGVLIDRIEIRNVNSSEYLYFTERNRELGFAWCDDISPVDGSSTLPRTTYTLTNASSALTNSFLTKTAPIYVNETINGSLYLLPQVLPADAELEIRYLIKDRSNGALIDENVVTVPLFGTPDWPVGKTVRYTFTLDIPNRQIVDVSTDITDWVGSGNTHSPQELMY